MAEAPFTFDQSPRVDMCSDAAKAEILDECEEVFSQLQKLQNMIISSDTEACDVERSETPDYLNALAAELDQLKQMEPKLISTNPEILAAVGMDELKTLDSQLDMVVSYQETKRESLRESLRREKLWLKEKKQVLNAVTDQVEAERLENDKLSENSKLQGMKRKIKKMKDYQATLMETLSELLEEHFPGPKQVRATTGRKKTTTAEPEVDLLPLSEVLELLTNKTLETPHEPYVTMDDRFWTPYVEMLLRYGIATRHSEDHTKIRLESFY
ncbi:centromere protein K isoform X2 [Clupea harengus]|uniref:Centromere protein K isoform X2 n=1 Tax=Clupea harengus TaxID=7950 RepID=A0A6P8F2R2_CLUHA|nr:centromere protein K isoform X2 [Clupea harengus]